MTATSITVKPAFADQEYSLDHGIGWVSAENNKLIFDGLKPDTDYELITRKAETDTKAASEASEPMKIRTLTGTVLTEIRANDDMLPLISVSGLLQTGHQHQRLLPSRLSARLQFFLNRRIMYPILTERVLQQIQELLPSETEMEFPVQKSSRITKLALQFRAGRIRRL